MIIIRINHIKMLSKIRSHFRQIRSASATNNQHVYVIFVLLQILHRINRRAGQSLYAIGIPTGENTCEYCILCITNSAFHTLTQENTQE